MEIKSAEFVISNADVKKCPTDGKVEYAFIGRSNVGKSSLINMLTRNKKTQEKITKIIEDYILTREQMANLFLLIDIRLEPQKIDLEFMEWLGENGIPFSIVFTKADKLSKGKASANVRKYLDELSKQWEELPPHFLTSSETKQGREELLDYIDEIIASLGTA